MKKLVILFCITLIIVIGCQTQSGTIPSSKIAWHKDIPAAIETAQAKDKPVLIQFGAEWCPYCIKLNDETLSDSTVIEKLNAFAVVKIDVDKDSALADSYQANARKYGGVGIPNVLFLSKDESVLKHVIGFRNPEEFVAVLDSVLILAVDNP